MNYPQTPKKQTQNKPNSNPIKACPELAEALSAAEGAVEWANFRKAKMNVKSLAGKSGHTMIQHPPLWC